MNNSRSETRPAAFRQAVVAHSRSRIQRLAWASVYNVLAIQVIAAIFSHSWGWPLHPGGLALLMSVSSLIVAVNAVMLCRADKPMRA